MVLVNTYTFRTSLGMTKHCPSRINGVVLHVAVDNWLYVSATTVLYMV